MRFLESIDRLNWLVSAIRTLCAIGVFRRAIRNKFKSGTGRLKKHYPYSKTLFGYIMAKIRYFGETLDILKRKLGFQCLFSSQALGTTGSEKVNIGLVIMASVGDVFPPFTRAGTHF